MFGTTERFHALKDEVDLFETVAFEMAAFFVFHFVLSRHPDDEVIVTESMSGKLKPPHKMFFLWNFDSSFKKSRTLFRAPTSAPSDL